MNVIKPISGVTLGLATLGAANNSLYMHMWLL